MADFRRSMLGLFQQSVDAVNNAVMHVSNATRNKMDEIALQNQRKELLENLANTIYEQWLQGETYPESITGILEQLKAMNEQIDTLAKQEEKTAEEILKQTEKAADDLFKQTGKAADSLLKQAEKVAADLDLAETVEPVQERKASETPDVAPAIKVEAEEEEVPVWPEAPVMGEAPKITVEDESEPEE